MVNIRRSADRGHFDHGWLDTYHTFSFGDYYDPGQMGFKSLRVVNEDRVQPGQGFGMHGHRDMEIITYVLSGELEHRDNLGNRGIIRPGEVQYMAAGTGIMHGEFNPSPDNPVHLIQIWIRPNKAGAPPRYEQRPFPGLSTAGVLTLLASPDGRERSIRINQDAELHAAALGPGQMVRHEARPGRGRWVQVLRGGASLNEARLRAGDGASVIDDGALTISAAEPAEILLFDLA